MMSTQKIDELNKKSLCYIVMPEDHSSMVVYHSLVEAQLAAKKLSDVSGVEFDIYPGLIEVPIE